MSLRVSCSPKCLAGSFFQEGHLLLAQDSFLSTQAREASLLLWQARPNIELFPVRELKKGFTFFSFELESAVSKISFNFRQTGFIMKLMGLKLQAPQVYRPFPRPGQRPSDVFKWSYAFVKFETVNYLCITFLKEDPLCF